ncbi:unnamed protein product [Heligmosomoides polygyrus]|uniref:Uncharacterized protein n=1 Tax=Heligmosomoides polygyrus TaxID=6339 RepID=A0A183GR28_HELPZ|nr:unnamed protein product [Heligmosomoides polygyrus]
MNTTNTCQPQCRNAVLNVYQNKLGRTLLRSDATCIPGREELRHCNFLPTASVVHCSLAKLACEADLQVIDRLSIKNSAPVKQRPVVKGLWVTKKQWD